MARELVGGAVRVVRDERQDPLVRDAGTLFARLTRGSYSGLAAGRGRARDPRREGVSDRATAAPRPRPRCRRGARDQLFLAFRLASVAAYCAATEPLPFVVDDCLVNFDDPRTEATLDVLADFADRTQVLLFTHHTSIRDAASKLQRSGRASVVEVAP